MIGAVRFAAFIALPVALACWVGGAYADRGGTSSQAGVYGQLIELKRIDWQVARAKRCMNDRRFARTIQQIPLRYRDDVYRWTNRHVRTLRRSSDPRAECWRSHLWAESWAGRCVSAGEGVDGVGESGGNPRARSRPTGTYAGKWQMNRDFELAYAPGFAQRLGRAWNWPEWLQDLAAWRGWGARGWHPWPTTSRRCGLL